MQHVGSGLGMGAVMTLCGQEGVYTHSTHCTSKLVPLLVLAVVMQHSHSSQFTSTVYEQPYPPHRVDVANYMFTFRRCPGPEHGA